MTYWTHEQQITFAKAEGWQILEGWTTKIGLHNGVPCGSTYDNWTIREIPSYNTIDEIKKIEDILREKYLQFCEPPTNDGDDWLFSWSSKTVNIEEYKCWNKSEIIARGKPLLELLENT